jgi:hypothetical protein
MQFESIPFTKELMRLLKTIPLEQWDIISVSDLVKKAIGNLQPTAATESKDPNVLEIRAVDQQEGHDHFGT